MKMKKLMALLLALLTCFAAALADTASAPDIPQGTLNAEVTPFTPGQTYAVYSAPDSRSIRGAKGRARVSTNGWIQVFGAEGDWLLVQYAITPEHCRIGYIDRNALPQDVVVPALTLEAVPAIVSYDVSVTDDPLMSQTPLTRLTENTSVTALASMGDWTYIEAGTGKSPLPRVRPHRVSAGNSYRHPRGEPRHPRQLETVCGQLRGCGTDYLPCGWQHDGLCCAGRRDAR